MNHMLRRGQPVEATAASIAVQQGLQLKHPGQNIDHHCPTCRNSYYRWLLFIRMMILFGIPSQIIMPLSWGFVGAPY